MMVIEAVIGLLLASAVAGMVIKNNADPTILLVIGVLFFVIVMVLAS